MQGGGGQTLTVAREINGTISLVPLQLRPPEVLGKNV